MPFRRAAASAVFLCLASVGLSSCLARRRVITRAGGKVTQTLLVSDVHALIDIVARQYEAVHDFNATVDLVPALGSTEKNRIVEYKDVRGFVLFRKPADIRIVGLLPVVRTTAFDMVSNGSTFKLYIPSKDRFITGRNEIVSPAPEKLYNLRPQHFLDALLVRPIDPLLDKPLLENFTDEDNAAYILHLVREDSGGALRITRTIWFSRLTLHIARQVVFDEHSNILTDARYSDWQNYDGVPFPKHVEINRPRDEYAVVLTVVKLDVNKGVDDAKFVLDRPEGSKLQVLGDTPPDSPPTAPPQSKGTNRNR
jgi:outer membrane lipoprotein-sorting protein